MISVPFSIDKIDNIYTFIFAVIAVIVTIWKINRENMKIKKDEIKEIHDHNKKLGKYINTLNKHNKKLDDRISENDRLTNIALNVSVDAHARIDKITNENITDKITMVLKGNENEKK